MINKNFLLLTFVFLIAGTFAIGEIYFSSPTSNNNLITNINWTVVNLTANATGDYYSFVDFDNSLIGWWRFEGNFNDELGRYNGTPSSPIYLQGKFGNATNFTATNSVSVGNIPFSNNEYTISGWVKTTDPGASEVWRNWISKTTGENTPFELGIDQGPFNEGTNTPYYLVWIFGQGAPVNIFANDSSINMRDGQWHFITATYKSGEQKLYHNSTLVGSATFVSSLPVTASEVTMGGQQLGSYHAPWKGDIDDVIIFNRTLSTSEIASLYNATANRYYNNFTSLNAGNHTYTGYFVNSSGFKNQTETRTITMDFQIPIISNVFFYPNDTNTLDPGINVTFNATITSTTAIQSALLELFNGTGWKNYSMSNISSAYTANLTLLLIEANYTYVIWANNTAGSVGTTNNATFSALWDCTWNSTSDLGAIAGFNENKQIGNITLNNTGDIQYGNNNCSLDFRLSYNLQEGRIYYDNEYVKNLNSYTIPAKGNRTISINASFLGETSQENAIITLDEFRTRSDTRYRNTTLTLVSNQNGPYLYQKITSSSTSASLTPANFSLQGYLRNLMGSSTVNENNTAYNVTFYWSLPSGLTNISGNLRTNYTNITDSSLNYTNINISFSDLASFSAGIKTIYLYAYGFNISGGLINHSNGVTLLSEQINITFSCYNVSDGIYVTSCGTLDGDYVTPTAGSSGGGGGGAAGGGGGEPFAKFIKEERFELARGKENQFAIKFDNPYPYGNLTKLNVTLIGLLSEYIDVNPKSIEILSAGKSINITAKITSPKYFEEGVYELIFELNGKLVTGTDEQSFTARKKIKLYIFEVTREELIKEIERANSLLDDVKSKNYSYIKMENLLNEINTFYNQSEIGKAHARYLELKTLYENAIEARKTMQQLNDKVQEAQLNGISTADTKRLIELAEAAFLRGDYALALSRLKEAQLSYALEVKGEFNPAYYVKNHPIQSLGLLLGVCLISLVSTVVTRRVLLNSKLKLLAEEEKLLIGLMKVVQRECFEEKRMSMEEYENTMSQYESRLNVVIQDTIEAQTKLANLMRIKGGRKKVLKDEVLRLRELIRETQKAYFEKSQMETRIYQNMIKSYAAKLSEVEENLATIEAQEELNKKGLGIWKR
jgi:tetratricopeptide (TPR) repeat protein